MTQTNTISNTAFYCCGIRMEDALRKNPVCNDQFAKYFMDEKALEIYEPFRSETMANISNVTRCRIIDDILRDEIAKNAKINVITIGAGFDTRPYRLQGGQWLELDEPQIIDYKNERLPASECKNNLERVSICFSGESLSEKLKTVAKNEPVIIVIEGVFMYLEPDNIINTINALQSCFAKHVLLCDLMNKNFYEKYAQKTHAKLVDAGGTFTTRPEYPAEVFINNNYVETDHIPMNRRARELGIYRDIFKLPLFIFNIMGLLMKDLEGYAIHRFHYG